MIEYNGIAYSFRNYNCYDHVVRVRKDNGIKTKLFKPRNIDTAFSVISAEMQKLDHGLTKADTPENYDIVFVSKTISGRKVHHCGIYFDGLVSHCDRTAKQVRMEQLADFSATYEAPTFWR